MAVGHDVTYEVRITNRGTKKRSFYVVIKPQGSSRYQEREYTLRVG